MEIKRKTEICVQTKRRFIVRQPQQNEQVVCSDCAELMLAAEQAAVLLSVSRRRIYQLVETGATHFIETGAGALLVCPNSLAKILDTQNKIL